MDQLLRCLRCRRTLWRLQDVGPRPRTRPQGPRCVHRDEDGDGEVVKGNAESLYLKRQINMVGGWTTRTPTSSPNGIMLRCSFSRGLLVALIIGAIVVYLVRPTPQT